MILMSAVKVEVIRQKLWQLWRLLIKWRIASFFQWFFSRLRYFCKLLEMKLPAVKSTRQFIIKRIYRVPNPSSLWSSTLKARQPLPTSAAWLNFVLNEGSMPEYIHPYVISCSQGALCICYCPPTNESQTIKQGFVPDIIVGSASSDSAPFAKQHTITSFDDLSVTIQLQEDIEVPLVRGCPYVTFIFKTMTFPTFSSAHKVNKLEDTETHTKHKLFLENHQTWIIYSSHKLVLQLVEPGMVKVKEEYKGHLRIVLLNGGADAEKVLDEHAATYPVGGKADLSVPFEVKYTWGKVGLKQKTLLMLRLPTHSKMMAHAANMDLNKDGTCVHPNVAYDGIDGKMEAIASDSWVLKAQDISLSKTWYSIGGIQDNQNKKYLEAVLRRNMSELVPLPENVVSAYRHGKFLAQVARMAIIAEELGSCLDLLKQAREFLSDSLTPWVEGTLRCNAFIYDPKWGGIITHEKQTWLSQTAKGVYDDAHYTLGYFCYAGAVLSKLDGAWGEAHKPHLYTLVRDYMSVKSVRQKNEFDLSNPYAFPKLRYFDLWVLHSWSGDGLVECEHGRRQISSSEAVFAYYAGAMLGLAFQDDDLVNLGLTLASFELKAAQLLWHIPSSSSIYPPLFKYYNRIVGVLWANKRESVGPISTADVFTQTAQHAFRLPPSTESEISGETPILPFHLVGMQVPPLIPISEFLFIDTAFAEELVNWVSPFLNIIEADTWKGYVYALESLYKPNSDIAKKAFSLSYPHQESSTSLSILLWWIYSRKIKI